MNTSNIKLSWLSIITILIGITTVTAKEYVDIVYDLSSDVISEEVLPITEDDLNYHALRDNENPNDIAQGEDSNGLLTDIERSIDLRQTTPSYIVNNSVAANLLSGACYEVRRVWVWSGWRPKRVWKRVRVTCSQAARGPGTTIPPH